MQMAPGGPAGGSHPRHDLPCLDLVPGADGNGFEMVVGGDEAIAVVDLHPVSASPGMPASRPHNTRIRGINRCAAGGGIVLAKVEVPRCTAERADPGTEG